MRSRRGPETYSTTMFHSPSGLAATFLQLTFFQDGSVIGNLSPSANDLLQFGGVEELQQFDLGRRKLQNRLAGTLAYYGQDFRIGDISRRAGKEIKVHSRVDHALLSGIQRKQIELLLVCDRNLRLASQFGGDNRIAACNLAP